MLAPTSGLARITIRAPRRRVDLAIPHQVPLAEILPELLRRAGEAADGYDASAVPPTGGWALRRGGGGLLDGDLSLAQQGVRDGDVLYLVPRGLTWPEPAYDDVIEEVAAGARGHGPAWDGTATRLTALVAAALVLLAGAGLLLAAGSDAPAAGPYAAAAATVVALGLLVAGALLSRALGDGVTGAVAGGLALPYAAVSGVLFTGSPSPGDGLITEQILVGASALLFASVLGFVAVGHGLAFFTAGATAGLFAGVGSVIAFAAGGPGAAAILVVVLVAGIGLLPALAVRLGRVPVPIVSAAPEVLAAERRPERSTVVAAVVRADDLLAGCLLGTALTAAGCVGVLAGTDGTAGPLLGALASAALLLRARQFPAVATRLPLLGGGLLGGAIVAWAALADAGPGPRLAGAAVGLVAVVVLLAVAASANQRRGGPSPYLGRLADLIDVGAVVALAPVACAVLGLYAWVRGLAG